ncbi:MAG: BRO family protein, partial [archaeon]
MSENTAIVVFQDKKIRRLWHKEEWWFSVVDVVGILAESEDPRNYWKVLKHRLNEEGGNEPVTNCNQLKLPAEDGKMRETDCANTTTLFRIIQSIPSPKAEPFKQWLAKVGYERVQEIEDPERAQKRMVELYRAKGYSEEWIEKRIRGIVVREELTQEWRERKVQEGKEFAILTAEISKATFGITPTEHKNIKGIQKENLRDHMTGLELIFTMLGEASTTKIAQKTNAQGFNENKKAANEG